MSSTTTNNTEERKENRRHQGFNNRKRREANKAASASYDKRKVQPQTKHAGSYAFTHAEELSALNIPKPTASKKKYAVMFCYLGTGYAGMQMNPGVKSIEAELEKAFYVAGGIADTNFGCTQKIGWTRCARTDKGVHALGQTISVKLCIDESDSGVTKFIKKVNDLLPSEIEITDMIRCTGSFNAKRACEKRTYEYLAPTYIFAPKNKSGIIGNDRINYRISSEQHAALNNILGQYEGTHNFHNFTSGLKFDDPSAIRYIMSFKADAPFVDSSTGREWTKLTVVGQSFLLHHIRKMIGLAAEILRGSASHVKVVDGFEELKMDLPKAPSEGLFLGKPHFDYYNKDYGKSHGRIDIDETPHRREVVSAFRERIFKHLFKEDAEDNVFLSWMDALDHSEQQYLKQSLEEWTASKKQKSES